MTGATAASLPSARKENTNTEPAIDGVGRGRSRSELLTRVIAASFMVPVGLWVVYAGGWWIAIASAVCAALAAYEWIGMMQAKGGGATLRPAIFLSGLAVAVAFGGLVSIPTILGVSVIGALVSLPAARLLKVNAGYLALGAIYVSAPFGAFVFLREHAAHGAALLIAVMLIVWTTDIAAFLAGKGFGGPQLAPRGSPNKTWSGAIGAFCCAMITGAVIARMSGQSILIWSIVAGCLSVVAQQGDILESGFKRRFGVKDASGLIPGHGGVLDRLDSLMACTMLLAIGHLFWPDRVNSLLGA